jgi:hypothetical protein
MPLASFRCSRSSGEMVFASFGPTKSWHFPFKDSTHSSGNVWLINTIGFVSFFITILEKRLITTMGDDSSLRNY